MPLFLRYPFYIVRAKVGVDSWLRYGPFKDAKSAQAYIATLSVTGDFGSVQAEILEVQKPVKQP